MHLRVCRLIGVRSQQVVQALVTDALKKPFDVDPCMSECVHNLQHSYVCLITHGQGAQDID